MFHLWRGGAAGGPHAVQCSAVQCSAGVEWEEPQEGRLAADLKGGAFEAAAHRKLDLLLCSPVSAE
jgi:hypothetical protein